MASLFLPILLLFSLPLFPQDDLTQNGDDRIPLPELLDQRKFRDFLGEDYHDRIEIIRKAMEDEFETLRKLLRKDNPEKRFEALKRIRSLAEHALEESEKETSPDELRDKEVKKLEIFCRRRSEELAELRRKVPSEERAAFDAAAFSMDQLRGRLLKQLFGPAAPSPPGSFALRSAFRTSETTSRAAPTQSLAHLDRFTEEEFSEIQNAQELEKRVQVFLEIAESRLVEMERRMKSEEPETDAEDTENPLEFHTFEDMLHAYNRAIEGVMTNIDEKATRRSSEEQEIKKSLERLSAAIERFIPRLQVIRRHAETTQDRSLYKKVQVALDTSDVARKGALFGLGAPPD